MHAWEWTSMRQAMLFIGSIAQLVVSFHGVLGGAWPLKLATSRRGDGLWEMWWMMNVHFEAQQRGCLDDVWYAEPRHGFACPSPCFLGGALAVPQDKKFQLVPSASPRWSRWEKKGQVTQNAACLRQDVIWMQSEAIGMTTRIH